MGSYRGQLPLRIRPRRFFHITAAPPQREKSAQRYFAFPSPPSPAPAAGSPRVGSTSFDDWSLAFRHLPATAVPGDSPRAWATLILNDSGEPCGFLSAVWTAPSPKAAQTTEESLGEDFSRAVGKALSRVQSQSRATARKQAGVLLKIQQSFLQRMSHGASAALHCVILHGAGTPLPQQVNR